MILKCPICGNDSKKIHSGTRDRKDIDVYECLVCKSKFLSDINDRDYEKGFNLAEYTIKSDEEIEEWLNKCSKDDVRRADYLKDRCSKKRVLDFGCGYGGFLRNIIDVASVAKGVELSTFEREYLNKHGISCRKNIMEYEEKFDVITLFHVFEHLNNPDEWLSIFSNYLDDEGYLVIEVPHSNDALLSFYNNEKFADFTYWSGHLILYSEDGIKRLVDDSGKWKIDEICQVQRYPITNHLYWLAKGMPGGDSIWGMKFSDELNDEYVKCLKNNKSCDTLMVFLKKKKN